MFVNIGVPSQNKGTVSNALGEYNFQYDSEFETLVFSCIGYQSIRQSIKNLKMSSDISLEPIHYTFDEVELTASQFSDEEVIIGMKCEERRGISIGFGSAQLGTGIAAILRVDRETLVKEAGFRFNHAKGDSMKFRINFYDFRNDVVGESLMKDQIILSNKQQKGNLTIDLSSYEIVLEHDVLLALEWVEDDGGSGNQGLTFGTVKERKKRIWWKKSSVGAYAVNHGFKMPGNKNLTLCFYVSGKQIID